MKIKCAIFDFDGTLFDSMYIWEEIGKVYLRSLGKEPEPSLREEIRAMSLYQAACYMKKEYGLSLTPEEIMAGINEKIEDFYLYDVLPKPGALEFLGEMKKAGIMMCIATASDRKQVEAALIRCKMKDFFEEIIACNDIGHGKDEPVVFRRAMDYFGADRSTSLVFEDALHAARTAKADGFKVVGVFDESEKRQDELRQTTDFFLSDFKHTEEFWKFAAAE